MISTAITPQMVTHTARTVVTLADISEAMQRWYNHDEFDPEIPVLWDIRETTITPPDTSIKEWSDSNSRVINQLRAGRKTAWVFGNDRDAELAVEVLGSFDWKHKVRIFNQDVEAARAWLLSTIR